MDRTPTHQSTSTSFTTELKEKQKHKFKNHMTDLLMVYFEEEYSRSEIEKLLILFTMEQLLRKGNNEKISISIDDLSLKDLHDCFNNLLSKITVSYYKLPRGIDIETLIRYLID